MRTATTRAALLIFSLAGCGGRVAPTVTPAPASATASIDAEDMRVHARADSLRARILAAASWAEFAEDQCNPGALRTFITDTTKAGIERVQNDVQALESLVIARGVDNSIDTPEGHDLLRTLVQWEGAVARPKWDVPAGQKTREAIAAGLSGEFRNPASKRCESYVPLDSVTIVIPAVSSFSSPRMNKVRTTIFVGDTGLARGRAAFFAASRDHDVLFSYARIRALVLWRDYAVAAVNRQAQRQEMQPVDQGGGAAYIFHRVGREWRLLTITRTWG